MTLAEIQAERHYRIQERLGILCGNAKPTREQEEIALREADEWVEEERQRNISVPGVGYHMLQGIY